MLNCCIQHKISHTQRLHSPPSSSAVTSGSSQEPPELQTPTSSLSFSQRISSQLSLEENLSVGEEAKEESKTRQVRRSRSNHASSSSSEDEFFEAPESPTQLHKESSLERTIKELSLDDDSKVAGKLPSPSVKPRSVDLKPTANDPLSLLNDEDDEEGGAFPANQEAVSQEKSDIASTEGRVGALRPYKDLVLLRTGKPLYVPETQVSCK